MKNNTYISVTGGTGHLGRNLIDMLLQQGLKVKALKRNLEIPYQHPNLTWIQGDLSDLEKLNSPYRKQHGDHPLRQCHFFR